jgi:methylenetetrahydrofolate reductase (NADPH)
LQGEWGVTCVSATCSFEFFPPKTAAGVDSLFATIADLREFAPTFVSVTYGAGGSTRDLTIDLVTRIKREAGIEAMAHLTCVGHGREELRATLRQLAASGVENIMALRGDPPRGTTAFVRHPDGFGYGSELIASIKEDPEFDFCLGGACYPEKHIEARDPDIDLANLQQKVAAGVDFLVTQLFFDNAYYFAFVERARAAGIDLPIVPGIMPVTNVAQIERFTTMCGATIPQELRAILAACDDEEAVVAAGIEWATAQCRDLLAHGAPGLHFYTLNRSRATAEIVRNLGEALPVAVGAR